MNTKQIIKDIIDNKIFLSSYVRDTGSLSMVFMPIALGAFHNYTEEQVNDIGQFYEYYDQASPRCINGYPIFFSVRVISKKDWQIILNTLKDMVKTLESMKEKK